ncbi:MAG: hypothetical protein KDC92_05810 [Bacteroidetes bacterium]|nr:hypothetical protein [Bacteroidota bacterium]
MKKLITLIAVLGIVSTAFAQKVYLKDEENFDPTKETTIMVDISKCDCQRLLNNPGPLYMWTWNPAELPKGDPNHNGDWTSSNEALAMTNEGNNLWSFTMIPTEFYGVGAKKVYENGFSLLVKAKDGTGGGGGGCDEDKTEDLIIEVEAPEGPSIALVAIPTAPAVDDLLTIVYDNTTEENVNMQNLAEGDAYVVPSVLGSDSVSYNYAPFFSITDYNELIMTRLDNGKFIWVIEPEAFFKAKLPAGVTPIQITIVIRKKVYKTSADRVSDDLTVLVGCQ